MNAVAASNAAPRVTRAAVPVELYVGIEAVMEHAFPQVRTAEATNDPFGERRKLNGRVKDVGARGLVIECVPGDISHVPIGSIVAFGFARAPASDLGVVIRTIRGASGNEAWIGVRRLTSHACPKPIASHGARGGLLFVPGSDEIGCQDACLV
jgi:hypothetical protein